MSVSERPFLSIVIPAYNEEKRLAGTLKQIWAFLREQEFAAEVVVVDDGSRDRTAQIARDFGTDKPIRVLGDGANHGKGWAVRTGMLQAAGEHVLFSDADLSTPMEEVLAFFPSVQEGYDVVIGSRGLPGSVLEVREPWHRELLGRAGNLVIQPAAGLWGIRDTQCGFKMFRRQACQDVFSRTLMDGISFDVEILYLARRMGYRIKESPVRWAFVPGSKIRLWRDSCRMLRDLGRLRFVHRDVPHLALEPERRA